MDLNEWVLRDGVVARASGRVLLIDGVAWFEWPPPRALPLITPRPTPTTGPYALRAHGVDAERLDRRDEYGDGVVEGWTTLTGTRHRGELYVDAQTPLPEPERRTNRWRRPPCPPPAAGWPTVPIIAPMTAANIPTQPPQLHEWEELTITSITQFRPHPAQPVLVVAAEDPQRAEQALRPLFGEALCVVTSRYRRQDIETAQHRLRQEMFSHHWPITMTGQASSDDGQVTVTAHFAWIEPEVARWAATVPDGLLDLEVWLKPVAT